jgi:hypothetical protein
MIPSGTVRRQRRRRRAPQGTDLWSSTSPLSLDTFVKSDKDLEDQGLSDVTKVPRGKGRRSLTGDMLREDEQSNRPANRLSKQCHGATYVPGTVPATPFSR